MLLNHFPTARFGNPATEDQIAFVEGELSCRLPRQLRRLYLEADGFREGQGNAKYLFSLTDEDHIGSLLSTTQFLWADVDAVDLTPYLFFGSSSGDEFWGVAHDGSDSIIAYHHHMGDEFDECGTDIIELYKADYASYDDID